MKYRIVRDGSDNLYSIEKYDGKSWRYIFSWEGGGCCFTLWGARRRLKKIIAGKGKPPKPPKIVIEEVEA